MPNHFYVYTHWHHDTGYPEQYEAMAAAIRGVPRSPEVKKKLSDAAFLQVWTDERRAKLSESMRGRKASQETRRKMSSSQKGRVFSAEHRAKLVEAYKRRKQRKDADA